MTEMEIIGKSFETVRDFLTTPFPEFKGFKVIACGDADRMYKESAREQAAEGKGPRVFAHTMHVSDTVCVTLKIAELTEPQRQGIFIHEFGHVYAAAHLECGDPAEQSTADIIAAQVFGVPIHYDENDIEYAKLPLGSEPLPGEEMSKEELQEALQELGVEETDDYNLGLPDSDDLRGSLELIPPDEAEKRGINPESGPVVDTELE